MLFLQNSEKLAAPAIREKLVMIGTLRDFVQAGGLMSYDLIFIKAHREAGVYVGRILRGDKPDEPSTRCTRSFKSASDDQSSAFGRQFPGGNGIGFIRKLCSSRKEKDRYMIEFLKVHGLWAYQSAIA